MSSLKATLAKQVDEHERVMRTLLSHNTKKFRTCRAWSQFTLAAKSDISTNFLADIEAGNTWVSASTLMKLARALDVEAYELLKPEGPPPVIGPDEEARSQELLDRYSRDMALVLHDSLDKAVDHLRRQYLR